MAEAGVTNGEESTSGRKISAEWSYNIGEGALDVAVVTCSASSCDILVLGERNLFCLNDNGMLKFMKRLDYKPCCFHPYCIGKCKRDSKRWTQFRTSIFPELYRVFHDFRA